MVLYQAALIMTCFTAFGGAPLPRGGRRDTCPMPRIALRAAPTRGANPLP